MYQQGSIDYNHELSTLIDLVKSGTPKGQRVTEVLRSGDKEGIRHMLQNFGNPQDEYWGDITSASPWTPRQIDKAVEDLNGIKPPEVMTKSLTDASSTSVKFWAW